MSMNTGDAQPRILYCDVSHQRLYPRRNGFTYRVWYVWLPLSAIGACANAVLSIDRFNLLSFYHRDHGARDGRHSRDWLSEQLDRFDLPHLQPDVFNGEWYLLCLPRVLGYVFNPVSFWCAMDEGGTLRAVIAEVHNTFGERHAYGLLHEDGRPIDAQAWLYADKQFHVSPFLEVEGRYAFRFDIREDRLGIWIDYADAAGERVLLTAMHGRFKPYKTVTLLKAFVHVPLVTVKVITLIHYQALKLWFKKIRYHCKPPYPGRSVSLWRQP